MEIGETKHSLLLVDADPKSLRVLDVVLKKAGFQVTAAPSGVEALSAMEQSMLDFAENVKENSRLSCQIKIRDDLDGLTVTTPESQH